MTAMHPFEKAGLGKAPFECFGMTENWYSAAPGHKQPGGSCKYCGTGIAYEYHIKSFDNHTFVVGCECVRKTKAQVKGFREARLAHTRKKREEGHAKRRAERQAVWAAERAQRNAEFVKAEPAIAEMLSTLLASWESNCEADERYQRRNYFMFQMAEAVARFGALTAGQLAAVKASIARDAQRKAEAAASQFVGELKQRITGEFEIIATRDTERSKFNAPWIKETVRWHLMKMNGNFFTYRGTKRLGDKGETVKLKGTVAEHAVYEGCRQTVLERPAEVFDETLGLRDPWGRLLDSRGRGIPGSNEYANLVEFKKAQRAAKRAKA